MHLTRQFSLHRIYLTANDDSLHIVLYGVLRSGTDIVRYCISNDETVFQL